ncbi:MAG: NAD(P)/FAD-dependent oxidoreductase [Candidatus Anstonellaceae archaeon]
MANEFDVIVVGAGPGGSTTASYLAKGGKKVLLVDKAKFPRDKTCGDALSGKTLKVLKELELIEKVKTLPHADIKGVIFSSPAGNVVEIPFLKSDQNRKDGTGYCIRRYYTDNMFFEAAKSFGAKTLEQTQVQGIIFDDKRAIGIRALDLVTKEQKEFYAKVVVGADGVNSIVAKEVLGEDANLEPEHSCDALRVYYKGIKNLTDNIEIHFFKSIQPGYFWIFPVGDGVANVGIGLVSSELQKRMKKTKKTLVHLLNESITSEKIIKDRFLEAKALGPITGWRLPFGSKKRKIAGDGWVLVGDAASLVDPFSGEGVGNATTSGRFAAKTILKAFEMNDFSYSILQDYEKKVWDELGAELNTSYQMQKLGRFQFLLDRVIYKAKTDQRVRDLIANSLASEETKKEFLNPFFYLKVLI